jgi:hypothetical protein
LTVALPSDDPTFLDLIVETRRRYGYHPVFDQARLDHQTRVYSYSSKKQLKLRISLGDKSRFPTRADVMNAANAAANAELIRTLFNIALSSQQKTETPPPSSKVI